MSDLVPVISKLVDIGGEQFCLEIVPKASTQLVKKEKDDLSANLDLPGLVGDLHKLASFVRVAYYGVAGSTDLQIKVQRVGFTVAKLCQESDVTVVLFKKACADVIETLQSTYEFLLDGLEDIAIDNLKGLSDVAKRMAEASDSLMKEFDKAKDMVQDTLEDTMTEKGNQENRKEEMKKLQEAERMRKEQEETKKAAAAEAAREKKTQYLSAQGKEQAAERELGDKLKEKGSTSHQLFSSISRGLNKMSGGLVGSDKDSIDDEIRNQERIAKEAREERIAFLKEAEEQQQAQLKATLEMQECVLRMQQAKVEEGLSESAIAALHGAQGALSAITVIMMQASKFWRMMQEHCTQMASEKMLKTIETTMEKPEKLRLKVWGSQGFIKGGVRYYAKWVALEDVCTTYRDEIRGAENQMYLFMKENPTTEEARHKVPELARALSADLEKAIGSMKQKSIENKKEMDANK